MDVSLGQAETNVSRIVSKLEALAAQDVDLAVFPEAALTGYCVASKDAALGIAVSGKALAPIKEAVDRLNILAVVGYAETDGTTVWNTATLFEPGVPNRNYRKTHLPYLGLDRFVEAGDRLEVFDTRIGRIGLLICFDLRLPEPTRTLALRGADIIVLPTNWPEGAEVSATSIAVARAAENHVFLAACNRVGEENGFRFIGHSKIVDPNGKLLALAADDKEQTILAEFDPLQARQKRRVVIPGEYETDAIASRRPTLYG
jgi:predicted amidohydrolase